MVVQTPNWSMVKSVAFPSKASPMGGFEGPLQSPAKYWDVRSLGESYERTRELHALEMSFKENFDGSC